MKETGHPLTILPFILIIFFLSGCNSKPLLYELSVNKTNCIFNFYPQTDIIYLNANYRWNISGLSEWIKASHTSGNAGSHAITLQSTHNSKKTPREGTLAITCGDKSLNIPIYQIENSPLSLNIKDTILHQGAKSLEIGVISPLDYDVIIPQYADWIQVESLPDDFRSGSVKLKLTPIKEENFTRKALIAFTCKEATMLTDTLRVTQTTESLESGIIPDKSILEFNYAGQTQELNINAANDWNIINLPEWIKAYPMEGNKWTKKIAVSCTKNTTFQQRNSRLSIKCGNTGTDILISQLPYSPIKTEYNDVYLPDDTQTFTLRYSNAADFSVEIPSTCTWLRVTQKDNTPTGIITFELSNKPLNQSARTVDVYLVNTSTSSREQTVRITQTQTYSANYKVLEAFYQATGGDSWFNKSGWLTPEHYSKWFGVSVHNDGSIAGLSLSDNNLSGTLEPVVGRFSNLLRLNVSNNQLSGSFPESLFSLKNLEFLNLSYNTMSFPFPERIPELSHLIHLNFTGLDLQRSNIPSRIRDLSRLQDLYLGHCNLEGDLIDSHIFYMTTLVNLALNNNNYKGQLPLSYLPNLRTLDVSNNQLGNYISPVLGLLPKLEEFDLRNNCLTTGIPNTLLKRFGEKYVDERVGPQTDFISGAKVLPAKNNLLHGDLIYEGDNPIAIIAYLHEPGYMGGLGIADYGVGISVDIKELEWSTENTTIGANSTTSGVDNYNAYKRYIQEHPQPGAYPAFEWCDSYNQTHGTGWYIPSPDELKNFHNFGIIGATMDALNNTGKYQELLSSYELSASECISVGDSNYPNVYNILHQKSEKRHVMLIRHFRKKQ